MSTRVGSDPGERGSHHGSVSRRRFLAGGLGGMVVLGFGGRSASRISRSGSATPAIALARPGIRVDVHSRVFNGQDLRLASFLQTVVAPGHREHAALIHAGAGLAQALAWALAPSGAAETWRLDALARRRGPELAVSDDPEILRDRDDANRRFRDALRVVLPGTEFFRLYLDRLRPGARATLGPPAAARLGRMAHAVVLDDDDVDLLLGPDSPERVLLSIRPLEAFRRYTDYRYLSVRELLQASRDGAAIADVVVPTVAAFEAGPGPRATPTPPRDRVVAMARLVTLCGGRVHPLVPFDAHDRAGARDALALAQDAVERRGFVGVTLSAPLDRDVAVEDPSLRALLAWCAREEVAVVAPGGPDGEPAARSLLARHPGLRVGVRALAAEIAPASAGRGGRPMRGIDWMRRSIEGDAREIHRSDAGGPAPAVLGAHAAAFLGLGRGRRTRERLEHFYDREGLTAPGWMRALDAAAPAPSAG